MFWIWGLLEWGKRGMRGGSVKGEGKQSRTEQSAGKKKNTHSTTKMKTIWKCSLIFNCFILFKIIEFKGRKCDHYSSIG